MTAATTRPDANPSRIPALRRHAARGTCVRFSPSDTGPRRDPASRPAAGQLSGFGAGFTGGGFTGGAPTGGAPGASGHTLGERRST